MTMSLLFSSVGAHPSIEDYTCSLWLKELRQSKLIKKSNLRMKADSQPRTFNLHPWKVSTLITPVPPAATKVSSYWTNKRSVSVTILDRKNQIQAQLNNTVPNLAGPFEYQTQTTQFGVRLSCDPTEKAIVKN